MNKYTYEKKKNGKNATGRPDKFNDPKEMERVINKYFADCAKNKKPFTVTGLCLAIETTRETLCKYEEKPEFTAAIKKAKLRVENFAEERLYAENGRQVIGAIFALKNFGWSDKMEINQKNQPPGLMTEAEREEIRARFKRISEEHARQEALKTPEQKQKEHEAMYG